jgi:hypothetical protein
MSFPAFADWLTAEWLPYTAGAAVAWALTWVPLLWGRRGPAQPNCGRCGYEVVGLTARRCPECGGHFDRVGVRPGGAWLTLPMPARLAALAVLFAVPCWLLARTVSSAAPGRWTGQAKTTLKRSESGAFVSVFLAGRFDRYAWELPDSPDEVEVELQRPGRRPEGPLTADQGEYGPRRTFRAPIDRAALLDWWRGLGVDVDARVEAEADRVVAESTPDLFADRHDQSPAGPFARRLAAARRATVLHPPFLFWPVYLGGWAVLWGVAAFLLIRRARAWAPRRDGGRPAGGAPGPSPADTPAAPLSGVPAVSPFLPPADEPGAVTIGSENTAPEPAAPEPPTPDRPPEQTGTANPNA